MKIENMGSTESAEVSCLVADAFYTKFSDKTSLSKSMLQKILKLIWIEESERFGMSIYTVKLEGEVVGAFGFTAFREAQLSIQLIAKACAVIKIIGLKNFVSFLKVGMHTNRKPECKEWYIDFIVVKEKFRNQNIGHTIMSSLDEMVARDYSAEQLSLYILKGNDRARHLYEKYGFMEDSASGKGDYHFMVKNSSNN